MFTSNSSPFKIGYYKKDIISKNNKTLLLASFPCAHFDLVKLVGSVFEDGLFILEKHEYDPAENDQTLEEFVDDFKKSAGIDFIILSTPCHFLMTRQKEKTVKVFMTTSKNFIEVFSGVEEIFGGYKEEITDTKKYYGRESEAFVELEDQNKKAIVRLGILKDGIIKFDQYYIDKINANELQEMLDSFYNDGEYDFVEILGRCKIAGMKKDEDFIWFVEVFSGQDENEAIYIKELTRIFKKYCSE